MEHEEKVNQGKRNKARGAKFELEVRADLEAKGYVVSKYMNQVNFDEAGNGSLAAAKHKFCGVGRPMAIGTGFPDFIAYNLGNLGSEGILGIECKVAKYLDALEKKKCKWLRENKKFSKIIVAHRTKEKNRVKIIYEEF